MAKLTWDMVEEAARNAGQSTAQGADGIMHLAKIVFQAQRAKLLTTKKGDTKITDLYKDYLIEANKSKFGAKVDVSNKDALRFGAAKLRTFAKFGELSGDTSAMWTLVPRAVSAINARANAEGKVEKKTGSRYEQVLRVMRFASKIQKAALRDDEIATALEPAQSNADELLRTLEALASRAKKFAESDTVSVYKRGFFAAIQAEAERQVEAYKHAYVSEVDAGDADDESEEDIDLSADDLDTLVIAESAPAPMLEAAE